MEEKEPLIILTGPTAVGKTDLSLKLAKRVDGEIISADSMQVYRQMDIGSAKIKSAICLLSCSLSSSIIGLPISNHLTTVLALSPKYLAH